MSVLAGGTTVLCGVFFVSFDKVEVGLCNHELMVNANIAMQSKILPQNLKKLKKVEKKLVDISERKAPWTGADPGFPVGGGANLQLCPKFPKNCIKLQKVWAVSPLLVYLQ